MSAPSDGVTCTALTEKKKNGEIFNDFYTNRKASTPSSQNTQLSAQAHDKDASPSAKVDNSSDTSRENEQEVKLSLREEKEDDTSTGVSSMIDAANKSDVGIRFNLRTEKDVQDKLRNYVASEVEKPGSISDWTATDIDGVIKETEWLINQIHTALYGNPRYDEWAQREPTVRRDWRDGEMHPIVTWVRGNIEYRYDVSEDLLCIVGFACTFSLFPWICKSTV